MNGKLLNKRIICFTIAALFSISLVFTACGQKAPHYEVSSLDALKAELKDYPEFIIPDIPYDLGSPPDVYYIVNQWEVHRNILNGYMIGVQVPIQIDDFTFRVWTCNCISLEHYEDELNKPAPLDPNTQYFGVDMVESIKDLTDNQELRNLYTVPEGAFFYSFFYRFDLSGNRYEIQADIVKPDSIDDVDGNAAAVAKGKAELLSIVKSIIDQDTALVQKGTETKNTVTPKLFPGCRAKMCLPRV